MLKNIFEERSNWAIVFLRLGIGIIFLIHGLGKLFSIGPAALGLETTAGFLTSIGVPAALFFAWVVALVETFGGLFVILGLLTRYSALLLTVDMIIAILLVHLPNGFVVANGGYEFALLLLLGSVALLFTGAGEKLSLERKLFEREF
jgi:putative oxidoreductase